MKYLDEYRDPELAKRLVGEIRKLVTRHWVLMEICGGQTHTLMRYGIDDLLPPEVELVHGPGCPVCVTPLEIIDKAVAIGSTPGVTLVSYGDMLRVPGSAERPVPGEGRGRRCADRVFADGRAEDRARRIPGARWCSSRSVSKLRPRPTPWRCGRQSAKGCAIFPCWSRTCWCRRPFACCLARPRTGCRVSSRQATSAPSWATPSTRSWPLLTVFLSWWAGSSRWTCWRPSSCW